MKKSNTTGFPTFLIRSGNTNRALLLTGSIWICVVILSGLVVWRVPSGSMAYYFRVVTLLATGIPAFLTPHILLPDADRPLIQMLNPAPPLLLSTRLSKMVPMLIIVSTPAIIGAFVFSHRGLAFSEVIILLTGSLLITCGIGLWAFAGFMSIGKLSQDWQEKKQGDLYRYYKENIQPGFSVPEGLVPSMLLTGRLLAAGLLSVFGWIVLSHYAGWIVGWMPALLPGCLGSILLVRLKNRFDRHFFQTNGYYGEVFQTSAGIRANSREPITFESLYWVPKKWRSLTWISLIQMDRKLPLGRWVIVGIVFLTAMAQSGVAVSTFLICLLILILIKNGALLSVLNTGCFPSGTLNGGWRFADQAGALAFVNLRWTLPLALTLILISSITEVISFNEVFVWISVDVFSATLVGAGLLATHTKKNVGLYA